MMRINLLPPEILERRKSEKRIGWVVLAAILIAVVLAGVWMFAFFRLEGKQDDLAAAQQEVQQTNAQAEQLSVFEQRAAELETRRVTAAQALDGRRNWSKLFNELSLVVPAEMWLETMTVDEEQLQVSGWAIDSPNDNPDAGHKSMAKLLVRLADLEQLSSVWLTSSVKSDFEERPALQFAVTASITETATGSETP